jgi:hypothetical protein
VSEIRGIFSAIGVPVADAIALHQRKPAHEKKLTVIGSAAALLAWCFYLWPIFAQPVGHAPFTASHDALITAGIWAAVLIGALLALLAGLRGVRGMRDWSAALWRLLLAGGCAALLWQEVYPADWPAAAFLVKGFYWGWFGAHLAHFCAAAQLLGSGSAFGVVTRALKDIEFNWDGAPRRRWWQFWKRRR